MSKSKFSDVLNHFKSVDPLIYMVMKDIDFEKWFEVDSPSDSKKSNSNESLLEKTYFEALCRSIVGQQLSGKAADAIYKKFKALLKNNITPDKVLKISDQNYRDNGLSWAKIKYIKDLAQKIKGKELQLKKIHVLEDIKVVEELVKVKGIGPWTAEMFLMFTLKRQNIFSYGDLGLKNGLIKIYNLKNLSKPKIDKIIKRWEPYKTFGSIALWHSLEK